MNENFKNKNYIITGASSGIGFASSKLLLEKGANVLAIGRQKDKVSELIENFPEKFNFLSIDFANDLDIEFEKDIKVFVEQFGKINGFLNCAGKEETLPLSMYNRKTISNLFNVNLLSPFELFRVVSKKKYSEDGSSFIFMSSVMGELGQPGKTGYCSTKAAILGLVKASALEFAPRKIRVNAIAPGVVDTPMTQKLFSQLSEENIDAITKMHPLGVGQISDITSLILFLLSDNSRWITGQNLIIDGGYSIQ